MYNVFKYLRNRESGRADQTWQAEYAHARLSRLGLSKDKMVNTAHEGAITCFSLEAVDSRYLLAGAADSTMAIYDTEVHSISGSAQVNAVGQVRRGQAGGHRFLVSSVAWYPVDTGLFVSGSFDHEVKVWDTNQLEVACRFALPGKVFAVAMSAVASTHCLVAVGSEETNVKLCDPASGGFSHTLTGHRDAVWALSWSVESEYQLMSGDKDGQLRLWDIRRSGTAAILDQHCTSAPELPKHQPPSSNLRRRNNTPAAASARARLSNPAARAHGGSITAVLASPNGLHWLSAATDDRIRLWDTAHLHHLLANYPGAFNRFLRGKQMSVTEDGHALFAPSGSVIQVFEVESGEAIGTLRNGHMDTINCCVWNGRSEELYTGGSDQEILVWDVQQQEEQGELGEDGEAAMDE